MRCQGVLAGHRRGDSPSLLRRSLGSLRGAPFSCRHFSRSSSSSLIARRKSTVRVPHLQQNIKRGSRKNRLPLFIFLVPKGGLEPPRISSPPPQDGVSTNSTTSASGGLCPPYKTKKLLKNYFLTGSATGAEAAGGATAGSAGVVTAGTSLITETDLAVEE